MQPSRALVIGGTGDIGGAICARLRPDFSDVVSAGSSELDLGSPSSIEAFFDRSGAEFDLLVHSAGLNVPKEFETLTDAEIQHALSVNLLGFLTVARKCIPHWKTSGGRVVVVSSLYGFLGRRGRLPYVIAKHALVGAVKTLAIELAEAGVLVNAVSPGYIATKMTTKNNSPEKIAKFVAGIPLRRLGTPDDIAEVVAFLGSQPNKYITGQDIVVDGGYSCGGFQG